MSDTAAPPFRVSLCFCRSVTVFRMQQDFVRACLPAPRPFWQYPSVSNRPYKLQPWWMVPSLLVSWRTSRKTFGTVDCGRMSLNLNLPLCCWLEILWLLPPPPPGTYLAPRPRFSKHLQLLFAATSPTPSPATIRKWKWKCSPPASLEQLMESKLKPKIKRKIHLPFSHPLPYFSQVPKKK